MTHLSADTTGTAEPPSEDQIARAPLMAFENGGPLTCYAGPFCTFCYHPYLDLGPLSFRSDRVCPYLSNWTLALCYSPSRSDDGTTDGKQRMSPSLETRLKAVPDREHRATLAPFDGCAQRRAEKAARGPRETAISVRPKEADSYVPLFPSSTLPRVPLRSVGWKYSPLLPPSLPH
jgi:hypothetical protein